MKPIRITDEDLSTWNDGSAAQTGMGHPCVVDANWLNALVCEVQAWRRECPDHAFQSGPNMIVELDQLQDVQG